MHAGIKCQVEFRKVFFRQGPRFNERNRLGGAGQANLFGKVEQIEVNLKDRRATQVSFRSQLFDQFFEGHVLVRESLKHRQAHACEQFAKTRIAGQIGAQGQVIQKEADQALAFDERPAGNGRAHDNVFLSGIAMQQNLEGREQGHEQGRAFAAAERRDRFGLGFRQHQPLARAVVRLFDGPGAIGRQIKDRQLAA